MTLPGMEAYILLNRGNSRPACVAGASFQLRVHLLIIQQRDSEAQISVSMCLMDQDTGWIREVENTVPLKDIMISEQSLKFSTEELEIYGSGNELTINAELPDASIELSGHVNAPILVNNGEGNFHFLGAQQYKFALPAIQLSGNVILMGKAQSVTGAMWLNRQFGALPRRFSLDRNLEHRQWINLYPQLDNGIRLSVSQLWDFTRNRQDTCCTVVLPDGTHIVEKIDPLEMNDFMTAGSLAVVIRAMWFFRTNLSKLACRSTCPTSNEKWFPR